MNTKQFLTLQTAAFLLFGVALLVIPRLFLEGIYQVDDAGDVGWIRLFGAILLGVGVMEWQLIANLATVGELVPAFIAVPALLTLAFIWVMIEGTTAFNDFFAWSSLGITTFFTLGHVWLRQRTSAIASAG